MPWTRSGDNAATYPALMQLQGTKGADDRLLNEVFGFVWRCSCQSAAHLTDYVVDAGTAHMLGGARTDELVRLCVKAGVFTPRTINGVRGWVLLQDPEFIHIQLAQEVHQARQQRNDTRNPTLRVPVVLRDGDNCRWCGIGVQWRGKRTNRTATLDHLRPGEPGTVETLVVACLGCNSGRKDNVETWDENHTLRPAPTAPNWGKTSAQYLTEHGYPTEQNVRSDDVSAAPAAGAQAAPTTRGVRRATPPGDRTNGAGKPPDSRPEVESKSTSKSLPQVDRSRSAGSGRDGSALGSSQVTPTSVPGTSSSGAPPPAPVSWPADPPPARPPDDRPRSRRRGRRGGRPRKPQGES